MAKPDVIAFPDEILDYRVAAIHTSEAAERVAWLIYFFLETRLWMQADELEVKNRNSTTTHKLYYTPLETLELDFWLITDTRNLSRTKPGADYLIAVRGEKADAFLSDNIPKLKNQHAIRLFYQLGDEVSSKYFWLAWLPGFTVTNNHNPDLEKDLIVDNV
jgi:hypothetical protein